MGGKAIRRWLLDTRGFRSLQMLLQQKPDKSVRFRQCVSTVVQHNSVPWADPQHQFRRESRRWTDLRKDCARNAVATRPYLHLQGSAEHKPINGSSIIDGLIQDP